MIYNFVNISSSKFSLNSREFFKTFLPISVGLTHVKIVNIYDNSGVLVTHTPVGDFLVDGIAYANSTDLSNAIYSVIFSKGSSESLDAQQVEANRLAIIALQNSGVDANHNHDIRYYTQLEIDNMIQSIVSSSDLLAKGVVDGESIKFKKEDETLLFSVDAKAFLNQGTSIQYDGTSLKLKNSKGETLSSTETDFPSNEDVANRLRTDTNEQGLEESKKINALENLSIVRPKTPTTRGSFRLKSDFDFTFQIGDGDIDYSNSDLEIIHDFDLGGATVVLPDNVNLVNGGGVFKNGTIQCENTVIQSGLNKFFDTDVNFTGTYFAANYYPQWFGALANGLNNDTDAVQSALNLNRNLTFTSGVFLVDELTIPTNSNGAVISGAGYYHYNNSQQTVIKARTLNQTHIFKLADGADNVVLQNMRIDGDDKAEICIDGEFGSFFSLNNTGIYNSLNYGFRGRQGLARFKNVYSNGHAEIGFEIYSDGTVSDCEFSGGTEPLKLVAGGNRLNNVWSNSGSVSCLTISPLDSTTTHINTSIQGLYAGETNGGLDEVPIIKILGLANQKVQDVQMSELHLVCASGGNRINNAIEVTYLNNLTIATPTVLGTVTPTSIKHLKSFIKASLSSNISVVGGTIRNAMKNPIDLGTGCFNVNLQGVSFVDCCTSIAVGDEGAIINVADNDNYGVINGCTVDIGGSSTVPFFMNGGDANKFGFDNNFVKYANTKIWTPDVNDFSGSYKRLGGKKIEVNICVDSSIIPNTTINNSKQNFNLKGTFPLSGGDTRTSFYVFPNILENQTFLITVNQQGSGNNNTTSLVSVYGSSVKTSFLGQSNSDPTLDMQILDNGSTLDFTIASGFGATTWEYTITRLG
jgi:hypothetical protein